MGVRYPLVGEEVFSQVSTELNDMDWVRTLGRGCADKIWWNCACGNTFLRAVKVASTKYINDCQQCATDRAAEILIQKAVSENGSLADHAPSLVPYWSKRNIRTASQVPQFSGLNAKWECPRCGYSWENIVSLQSLNGSTNPCKKCPKAGSENLISLGYDKIIDPIKNDMQQVARLGLYSRKKIWWICSRCKQSFLRSVRGVNDPNEVVCGPCKDPGKVSDSRPDLVAEWRSDNEVRPEEVSLYSWTWVWWVCSKCGNEWEAAVANRTNRGAGCPRCAKLRGGTSQLEQDMVMELSEALGEEVLNNPTVYTDDGERLVHPDMLLCDNIVVEYDSRYWHSDQYESDCDRVERLERSGYKVISIREVGLENIRPEDICYDPRTQSVSDVVRSIIDRVKELRH